MNVLRWAVGDQQVRRSQPPSTVQPFEPFLGQRVPVDRPGRTAGVGVQRGAPARERPGRLACAVEHRGRGSCDQVERGRAVRLLLLRRHRQDRPRTWLRRLLRRRAPLRRCARRRPDRCRAAGNRGARHRRSRPGRGGRRGSSIRPTSCCGPVTHAVGRGSVPLVALCAPATSPAWSTAAESEVGDVAWVVTQGTDARRGVVRADGVAAGPAPPRRCCARARTSR